MKMGAMVLAVAAIALAPATARAHKYANRAERIVAQIKDPASKNVLVCSHRGDWRGFPENSLPGFESAIRMGVDIIELDTQMTKDSVLVVCHDKSIDRTTNGKGKISDLTLAEIKQYFLKPGHSASITHWKMPTLEEALTLCKDRVVVNIDKGWEYYDEALKITEKLGVTGQMLIKGTASSDEVAAKMAKHEHNMMYMPITNFDKKGGAALYNEYRTKGIRPLAFEVCWNTMRPEVDEACTAIVAEGKSHLWVNTLWASLNGGLDDDTALDDPDAVYGKLLDMGVTMIQTDRPAYLIKYLHKRHRHLKPGK